MTQYDIFAIALDTYGTKIETLVTEVDDEHPEVSNEIRYCQRYYRDAEISCSELYEWSFLYKMHKYTSDELYKDYSDDRHFAYPVPEDFSYPVFVNDRYNSNIRRIGKYLVFDNENPELIYVSSKLDFENWDYPDNYGYLVAYRLAMEIFQNVCPDSNQYQYAVQKYGLVLQTLKNAEIKSNRKKNPSSWMFVY